MLGPPDRPAIPAAPGDELGAGELPATRLDIAGQALLTHRALGWRVEIVQPRWIGLRSAQGRVVLLNADTDSPLHASAELQPILSGVFPARHVVVLGGDASMRAQLQGLSSELAVRRIWLHHVGGDGAWQNREPRWRHRRVARALVDSGRVASNRSSWTRREARAHARRLELDGVLSRSEAQDVELFQALLRRRKARATVALVAVILGVFGLEALWGGVDLPPLLARMGSLVPGRVRAGEWWRFFSCTILHGGALHVGLNVLLLWMLGRSLERFIGSTRFLLIYLSAGLAGSLSSSLFVSSQSVGASGAIWGLFGAEAALAFYPRPLLPPVLIGVWRRTTLVYLGLNLVNSLNPRVDLAAHVGGGLMGALVLVLLAASGRLASHGRAAPPAGWSLRAAAALLCASFAIGGAVAIVHGRPWLLDSPPALERVTLRGSPWSIEIPSGRSPSLDGLASDPSELGNLAYDPSVVDISWVPLPTAASLGEPRDHLESIARDLAQRAASEPLIPPRVVADAAGRGPMLVARYRYPSALDLIDDRAIGIVDGLLVNVSVVAWSELPQAFEGLAPRILGSLTRSLASADGPRWRALFHSGFGSPLEVGSAGAAPTRRCLGKRRAVPFFDPVTADVTGAHRAGTHAGSSEAVSLAHPKVPVPCTRHASRALPQRVVSTSARQRVHSQDYRHFGKAEALRLAILQH